jgi:protein-tyrosine phosphatase
MHYVTESLLVGNLEDARRPPASVRSLLFVAGEHEIDPPPGVRFHRIPLKEYGEATAHSVLQAVQWLEREADGGKVMVCCRAGMGRSVSMVIAYLCCAKGMQYTDAVSLLMSRRPGASPLPNLETTIRHVQQLRGADSDRTIGRDFSVPSDRRSG